MNKCSIIFILCIISGPASAVNSKWFTSDVKMVYPLSTGDFVITFKDANPDCRDGKTGAYHYVREGSNSVSREGVKSMLSTVLTAASTGRKVSVNFDSDSEHCAVNRLHISF